MSKLSANDTVSLFGKGYRADSDGSDIHASCFEHIGSGRLYGFSRFVPVGVDKETWDWQIMYYLLEYSDTSAPYFFVQSTVDFEAKFKEHVE